MTYHDPQACELEFCATCEAYSFAFDRGWAAGKEKLAFEIHARLQETHLVGCGCQPCKLIELVVGALDLEFPALVKLWTASPSSAVRHTCSRDTKTAPRDDGREQGWT